MATGREHSENPEFQSAPAAGASPQGGERLSPEQQLHWIRVARRLNEAAGYLELGLPEKTVQILDELGDVGPFNPGAALLRGEALRLQSRFAEAAVSFEYAAQFIPPPFDRPAYLASSMCYREAGDLMRAINLLGFARGALPPNKRVVIRVRSQGQESYPPDQPDLSRNSGAPSS